MLPIGARTRVVGFLAFRHGHWRVTYCSISFAMKSSFSRQIQYTISNNSQFSILVLGQNGSQTLVWCICMQYKMWSTGTSLVCYEAAHKLAWQHGRSPECWNNNTLGTQCVFSHHQLCAFFFICQDWHCFQVMLIPLADTRHPTYLTCLKNAHFSRLNLMVLQSLQNSP